MRRLIAGAAIAVALSGSTAWASPGALAGVGQATAVAGCPNGFKIPIHASSDSGSVWTFTIAGAHVTCVVGWGSPISFAGPWNPRAPACNPSTGLGCPQSTDPTRPGFFSLGAVPQTLSLTQTTMRFCVSSRCFEGTAFVERA